MDSVEGCSVDSASVASPFVDPLCGAVRRLLCATAACHYTHLKNHLFKQLSTSRGAIVVSCDSGVTYSFQTYLLRPYLLTPNSVRLRPITGILYCSLNTAQQSLGRHQETAKEHPWLVWSIHSVKQLRWRCSDFIVWSTTFTVLVFDIARLIGHWDSWPWPPSCAVAVPWMISVGLLSRRHGRRVSEATVQISHRSGGLHLSLRVQQ